MKFKDVLFQRVNYKDPQGDVMLPDALECGSDPLVILEDLDLEKPPVGKATNIQFHKDLGWTADIEFKEGYNPKGRQLSYMFKMLSGEKKGEDFFKISKGEIVCMGVVKSHVDSTTPIIK